MKILLVGTALFHADGKTDMNLTVAFGIFWLILNGACRKPNFHGAPFSQLQTFQRTPKTAVQCSHCCLVFGRSRARKPVSLICLLFSLVPVSKYQDSTLKQPKDTSFYIYIYIYRGREREREKYLFCEETLRPKSRTFFPESRPNSFAHNFIWQLRCLGNPMRLPNHNSQLA
jgi:hypothetical protein